MSISRKDQSKQQELYVWAEFLTVQEFEDKKSCFIGTRLNEEEIEGKTRSRKFPFRSWYEYLELKMNFVLRFELLGMQEKQMTQRTTTALEQVVTWFSLSRIKSLVGTTCSWAISILERSFTAYLYMYSRKWQKMGTA